MNCLFRLFVVLGGLAAPTFQLSAQNLIDTPQEADSLRRVIATAKHDTTRINAMNELAIYLAHWTVKNDSAIVLAREAQHLSERIGYRSGSAGALIGFGLVSVRNKQYPQAREHYLAALKLHEEQGNRRGIAASLYFISYTFFQEAKYLEALSYIFKALRIFEELGNKRCVFWSLDLIGTMYIRLGKYNSALECFLKELKASEELSDKQKIVVSLQRIGDLFRNQGKYADALVYHQKALRIQENLISHDDEIVLLLATIGNDYGYSGQYAKALEYLFKALEMSGEKGSRSMRATYLNDIGYFYNCNSQFKKAQPYLYQSLRLQYEIKGAQNIFPELNTLNNLAVSYRGQGKFDSALVFARKALAITDSTGVKKSEKEALEALSSIMESLGRHKEALAYYKRYTDVKDSLINLESLNKTSELKEGYEAEKRDQQIALLNKERALQESELSHRRVIQWSLAGILAAVLVGAVWLGALYRQKNAANKAILLQQALLEDQASEIHQTNIELHQQNEALSVLNIEKNELMGIVSHDLKNPIGAVRSYAELIQTGIFTGDEVLGVAGNIMQINDRMLELVKNLLDMNQLESGGLQMNMVSFDILPVVEAVVDQYRTPASVKNITLHFSNDAGENIVVADELYLMQVLENIVSNAVKYSPHGKHVFVRVLRKTASVRVEVQDEGEGISADDMKQLFGKFARLSAQPTGGEHSTGLGLSIVKKMVEAMNGRVWCESELGQGATFIVELPAN